MEPRKQAFPLSSFFQKYRFQYGKNLVATQQARSKGISGGLALPNPTLPRLTLPRLTIPNHAKPRPFKPIPSGPL